MARPNHSTERSKMARKLSTVNKAATLYRCTVQTTTGRVILGAEWRTMDDATRCPNYASNKPRLGREVNNNNPVAVCADHVAQIRGEDAARSADVAVIDACVDAASDTRWMREAEDAAWIRAVAIVSAGWIPHASTVVKESHADAAEDAIVTTLTERAMRLYPMAARDAVREAATDAEVRGAIARVKPHIVFTVSLEHDIPADSHEMPDEALRENVLTAMVKAGFTAEVETLREVAASMEIREATRADATAWAQGKCVTRIRRVPGMREAAELYVEFRSTLNRHPVGV